MPIANGLNGEVIVVAIQNCASVEKDFLSSFSIPLPGYPISYKIDNIAMQCELIFEKNILVFGKYDLVFCCPNAINELESGYGTAILTRTFCESIPVTGSYVLEMLSGGLANMQAVFRQPLRLRFKLGKPSNLWDLFKSLFLRQTWVEVLVEGQIAVDLALGSGKIEESFPQTSVSTVIGMDALAEMVHKIISQREQERAAQDEAARGQTEVMDATRVTELVLNILHAREATKAQHERYMPQHPLGMPGQAQFNTPYPDGALHPQVPFPAGRAAYPTSPVPMVLDHIPSRPGLEVSIHNPPSKPPDMGG